MALKLAVKLKEVVLIWNEWNEINADNQCHYIDHYYCSLSQRKYKTSNPA